MRIVFLLTTSLERPYGGGRCFPLARELVRLGYTVDIVALHHDLRADTERTFTRDGVRIHYVGQMHIRERGGVKTYFSPLTLLRIVLASTFALLRKTRQLRPDIIHIGKIQPMNGLAGWLAAQLRHCALYIDCDDYEAKSNLFSSPWQQRVVAWFEDVVPLRAKAITVNTTFLLNRYRGLGIKPDKILHLPNGVNLARFAQIDQRVLEQLRQHLSLTGFQVVAYIGTISLINHAIDLLLEAFVQVNAQRPDTVLLLVGGGQDIEAISGHITRLGLADRVRLAGQVAASDIPHYYALADVTVDPVYDDVIARSRWPIKIMDSMAAAVPVVTGDVGDRRMMLNEGQAGVLVKPGCAQSLAEGILLLLEDLPLRKRIGSAARVHCQQWSWDHLASNVANLYEVKMEDSFIKQAGPPGYYRWLVATRYLGLPTVFDSPVLDIGAHNGAFLDGLDAEFKVGLDLMERPVNAHDWAQANATRLPFADNAFGHVLAFDVIEHVEQDAEIFNEIARVLKPGGLAWVSTPCADYYLFPGGRLQARFERAWGHVRRGYTRADLEGKLPPGLSGSFLLWNEPAQRHFYVLHKVLHRVLPFTARRLMDWAYAWDRAHTQGHRGHWFARLQKK